MVKTKEKSEVYFSTGSISNTLAEVFKKTGLAEMTFQNGNQSGEIVKDIPRAETTENNLDEFRTQISKVKTSTEELKTKAKKNSETMFASAVDYVRNCQEIDELQLLDPDELVLSGAMKILMELREEKKRIDTLFLRHHPPIRNQFSVDVHIALIETLQPKCDTDVIAKLELTLDGGLVCPEWNKIMSIGNRARLATNEENEYFTQKAKSREGLSKEEKRSMVSFATDSKRDTLLHIPSKMEGREGQVSGTDKKIFKALRELIYRLGVHKKEQKDQIYRKQEELLLKLKLGKSDHSLRYIADGVPGTYFLFLPGFVDKKAKEKKDRDGAAQICVFDLNKEKKEKDSFFVIKIIDGVGSMRLFGENKSEWFPLWWYRYFLQKKDVPENVVEERRETIRFYCRMIQRAVAYSLQK